MSGTSPVLSFTKLCVRDLARSSEFYQRALGMRETARYERPDLREIQLQYGDGPGEVSLVLMQWIPAREVVVGHEHGRLGIVTPDLDALFASVRRAGGKITEAAQELAEHGVRVGFVADPDGYSIEVVEPQAR
jgi:catechol 2,3-dioxygenase-like lactoylglutathione lyase family enzyme